MTNINQQKHALKMAHLKKVLVPDKNRPDVAELSKEITKGLSIVYVKEMSEAFPLPPPRFSYTHTQEDPQNRAGH